MIDQLKPLIGKLTIFAKDRMGFQHPPRLFLKSDSSNSKKMLGKTAYYDPQEKAVTLFTHNRHPKDILRSYAHELVHHTQNLRGDLSPEKCGEMGDGYAQANGHMREMEREAYEKGNMCFRDWEDTLNDKDIYIIIKIAESKNLKENKSMTTKITKEFLKETIRKLLSEQDEVKTKVPSKKAYKAALAQIKQINRGAHGYKKADLPAAKDVVARFEAAEKAAKSAEKAAEKNKLTKGLKSYFADTVGKKLEENLEENEMFAPSHYCVHHGGVQHEGKVVAAEAINHNYNEELGKVTHYDMKLEDGTILENVASEDIQVTSASLMNEHGSHPAKRDKKPKEGLEENEELEEESMPMIDEPEGQDLNGDGKEGSGKVPAFLNNKKKQEESKIQTPEQENALYEQRFAPKNNRLFEKLVKQWTK